MIILPNILGVIHKGAPVGLMRAINTYFKGATFYNAFLRRYPVLNQRITSEWPVIRPQQSTHIRDMVATLKSNESRPSG